MELLIPPFEVQTEKAAVDAPALNPPLLELLQANSWDTQHNGRSDPCFPKTKTNVSHTNKACLAVSSPFSQILYGVRNSQCKKKQVSSLTSVFLHLKFVLIKKIHAMQFKTKIQNNTGMLNEALDQKQILPKTSDLSEYQAFLKEAFYSIHNRASKRLIQWQVIIPSLSRFQYSVSKTRTLLDSSAFLLMLIFCLVAQALQDAR